MSGQVSRGSAGEYQADERQATWAAELGSSPVHSREDAQAQRASDLAAGNAEEMLEVLYHY